MRVFVLGGTGSIGGAVVDVLVAQGCEVVALSRSSDAALTLRNAGATPLMGDIQHPQDWIHCLAGVDAVIHAASTWCDEMDVIDQALVSALIDGLATPDASKILLYTGGCWLYGNTGNVLITESTPLSHAAEFSKTIGTMNSVLADSKVRGMVVHPAMVYERGGGVFAGMYDDAKKLGHVRVFGGLAVRWPLIHRNDLAQLMGLMLRKGCAGDVFNASSIEGVAIGDIAVAISTSTGVNTNPVVVDVEVAKKEWGDWAEGYAFDQLMSGSKACSELGWSPEHVDVFADIV